jgi:hypothetical protein
MAIASFVGMCDSRTYDRRVRFAWVICGRACSAQLSMGAELFEEN